MIRNEHPRSAVVPRLMHAVQHPSTHKAHWATPLKSKLTWNCLKYLVLDRFVGLEADCGCSVAAYSCHCGQCNAGICRDQHEIYDWHGLSWIIMDYHGLSMNLAKNKDLRRYQETAETFFMTPCPGTSLAWQVALKLLYHMTLDPAVRLLESWKMLESQPVNSQKCELKVI